MVFVIDGPPTITSDELKMAIKFIISIINSFPVTPWGAHIGVVVEQPSNKIVIDLGRYKEKSHIDAAVREIISSTSDSNEGNRPVGKRISHVYSKTPHICKNLEFKNLLG
jgi:hypothetical protein